MSFPSSSLLVIYSWSGRGLNDTCEPPTHPACFAHRPSVIRHLLLATCRFLSFPVPVGCLLGGRWLVWYGVVWCGGIWVTNDRVYLPTLSSPDTCHKVPLLVGATLSFSPTPLSPTENKATMSYRFTALVPENELQLIPLVDIEGNSLIVR